MEVPRSAPSQVDYRDVLPLAIPSSSNRRQFLPVNGSAFSPTGSNIIRIDVNADSMLDTQHSYLQYTIANGTAANNLYVDYGACFIQRLTIESGGVTLEDINEYGRLYAMLQCSQLSASKASCENPLLQGGNPTIANTLDKKYPVLQGGANNTAQNPSCLVGAVNRTFCIPLFSGLLNCEKYIPLILMNAGLTITIQLCSQRAIGISTVTANDAAGAGAGVLPNYSITDCRYVAHLVDMDRAFYDSLRAEMAMSGSIAIHGQTWRHFQGTVGAGQTSATINIPARMKSIKSIFTTHRYTNGTVNSNPVVGGNPVGRVYPTTPFEWCDTSGWQYQIGSVNYPQTQVSVGITNLATTASETLKAFGKLGDSVSDSCFSTANFQAGDTTTEVAAGAATSGLACPMFIIGYDLEAFQRSALESGIDTANRSLPINVQTTYGVATPAGGLTVDNYVVADAFFYVNSDGTATPST